MVSIILWYGQFYMEACPKQLRSKFELLQNIQNGLSFKFKPMGCEWPY